MLDVRSVSRSAVAALRGRRLRNIGRAVLGNAGGGRGEELASGGLPYKREVTRVLVLPFRG